MLDEATIARGRGRAYALLADLIARGPTESTLAPARASDALREALDTYAEMDDAAADHEHVFGLSVAPYEGAFLDPEGHVGGALTDRLRDRYRAMGFVHDPKGEGAEHLATQLRALAFSSVAEADAVEDEALPAISLIRTHTRGLLDVHLLRWLPSFAAATRDSGRPLPTAIAEQVLDVVLMHRSGLGEQAADAPPFELAGDSLDLDDSSVGIREIAAALAVPSRVGLILSRDDIARVGRGRRVPRGFGERRTLIHNLLRSAASLGALPEVVDDVRAVVAERRRALEDPRYQGVPGLGSCLSPWRERMAETEAALARLADEGRARQLFESASP